MNEPTKMEDHVLTESIGEPRSDLERVLAAVDNAAANLTGPGRFVMQALGLSLLEELRLKAYDEMQPAPTQEPPKMGTLPKRPFIYRLLKSVGF